uniref:C3/C5 convertase n=1 Tax=Loxosceles laeta TaxID=58217 RepID=A0A0U2DB60_LOXLA|nr:complement factor B-like protein Lox-FB [Loxosceles laeta]
MASVEWAILGFLFWISTVIRQAGSSVCRPLPYSSLRNGNIIAESGGTFRFECNKGYFLGGPSKIRCYKGNWTSERAPVCIESGEFCDAPQKIANAKLHGPTVYEIDSVIQYMCRPGYVLVGNGRRICLRSGYWSGITPTCMDESEPLQNVAERLNKEFVTKMASHSNDSSIQQAYYLDSASRRRGLDLVILVDRSSSVDPFDLNVAKKFIKYLLQEFGVKNSNSNQMGTRAAVIAFGTTIDIIFNLNDTHIDSPDAAGVALDELLKPNGGGTAMVPALTSVFLKVQPFLRERSKHALFLISDGEPNIGGDDITPEDISRQLKDHAAFEIFAVGIGPDVQRKTLASVASEPVLHHVFMLDKFTDLEDMMAIMKNRPTEEPPVSLDRCGRMDGRNESEGWPWVAAVYVSYEANNSTQLSLCAGALFCSQWVLTTASCFFYIEENRVSFNIEEVFVVMGEYDLMGEDPKQRNFYASKVVIHPDYDESDTLLNNLALVKLHKPVPLETFKPICLPPTDRTVPLFLDHNINASVAGWGISAPKNGFETISPSATRSQLTVRNVILAEELECRRRINRRLNETIVFCAEISGTTDNCVGNPGSPIIAKDPPTGINHVLGLLSQRNKCDKGSSQYFELTKYISWINKESDKCHFSHWN